MENSPSTPPTLPPTKHTTTQQHHPPHTSPEHPPNTPSPTLPTTTTTHPPHHYPPHPTPSPTTPPPLTHPSLPTPPPPTPRTLQPPTHGQKVGPLCLIFHGFLHIVYPFGRQIFGFPYLPLKLSFTLPHKEKMLWCSYFKSFIKLAIFSRIENFIPTPPPPTPHPTTHGEKVGP